MVKKPHLRRIYTGDNLPVLRCMDSETVDLIYLDPPFNSGKQWENPVEAGGKRALASFKDTWAVSDTHADEEYSLGLQYPAALPLIDSLYAVNGGSWKAYLIYMGVRLAEMRRILKPTGGIYYHCDPVMSHGVKLLMDAIFGGGGTKKSGNFRNEIVWWYSWGVHTSKQWNKKHDIILYYAKNIKKVIFDGDKVRVPYRPGSVMTTDPKWNKKYNPAGKLPEDVFDIPTINAMSKERTGYPTQKPLALLARIIKASSNEGGLVLDPFCGCATTCHAAEILGRQWIGIDLAEEAANLIVDRLQKESDKQLKSAFAKIKHLTALPKRTDLPKRTENAVLKPRLYKQQNKKCAGPCGENGEGRELPIDAMDLDHIIAKSRGGQDTDDNIQLLCRNCNTTKGGKGMDYLRRKILQRRTMEQMQLWREKWQRQKEKIDRLRGD